MGIDQNRRPVATSRDRELKPFDFRLEPGATPVLSEGEFLFETIFL